MRVQFQSYGRAWRQRSGSALLIVLLLLGVMTTLVVSNSVALRRLKVELQRLEEKQQRATVHRAEMLQAPQP